MGGHKRCLWTTDKKLSTSCVLKLKTCSSIQLFFWNHQTQSFVKYPVWLHLFAFKFYHCMMIQRSTWMWLTTWQCQTPWSHAEPYICLSLAKKKKKPAQTLKFINLCFLKKIATIFSLFWNSNKHQKNLRCLPMAPKFMRRILLQQYHLLPQISPLVQPFYSPQWLTVLKTPTYSYSHVD